jgi:hypothetical protein
VLHIAGWCAFTFGLLVAAAAVLVLRDPNGAAPPFLTAASAQECASEALPISAPPPQSAESEAVRLPATGNAGLLPGVCAVIPLQECPTAAPEPVLAEPTLAPTEMAPTATAAPSATPTITGPDVELPGGGAGNGGLDFPPGTVSY